MYGARGGGRTHNLRLRRPTLYPIELLARSGMKLRQRLGRGNWNFSRDGVNYFRGGLSGGGTYVCQVIPDSGLN